MNCLNIFVALCMYFYFSRLLLCLTLFFLLLSRVSRVQLCAIPQTAAHQALVGFSRQEHWSGLPFPSPMHESEKWKWSRSVVSDSWRPDGLQPTRLLCPCDFPGKSTGVDCRCLLRWSLMCLIFFFIFVFCCGFKWIDYLNFWTHEWQPIIF